ncbi:MAG: low molecular weight phosphotyrosine protein phosphatase [Simplicispira sp.]|nr:low molecular weight phosphotyrosine protein phosphatase [Simplicispira sp.]
MNQFSVLFVCMGNLCRSPTAHAVFQQRVGQAGLDSSVRIDSAGTHASPHGERPDSRAQVCARQRGYVLNGLRSRPVIASDFTTFDLLLAMDDDNLAHLRRHAPPQELHRLRRLTDFCLHSPTSQGVPDPYYGNVQGFEQVLNLIEDACDGLLVHVQQQLRAAPEQAGKSSK